MALGTGSITLQQIIDHITDTNNAGPDALAQDGLSEAFSEARANASSGFDATYNYAPDERMSEFRGFDYQGGGGGADGKAWEEGKGLDTDGNEMCAEGSIESESGDEAEDVGVDHPHAEHFDPLR